MRVAVTLEMGTGCEAGEPASQQLRKVLWPHGMFLAQCEVDGKSPHKFSRCFCVGIDKWAQVLLPGLPLHEVATMLKSVALERRCVFC